MGMPFGIDPAQNPRRQKWQGRGVVLIGVNAQAFCSCTVPLWGRHANIRARSGSALFDLYQEQRRHGALRMNEYRSGKVRS
jgi:hypothetical protein